MERNLAGKLQTRLWVNRINLFPAFLQVTLYLALTLFFRTLLNYEPTSFIAKGGGPVFL
jgi:hypothetical protein